MILPPKYWVLWDNQVNDIVVKTLSKSLQNSRYLANGFLGEDFIFEMEEKGQMEFKLVEINKVFV